jgi:hypothetical protein
MLALAGCAGQAAQSAVDHAPAPTQMSRAPQGEAENCRDFTVQVTIGGRSQQAVGQVCQQPDGSWRVTQNTPGLPQQVYTLPPQAISLYGDSEPYYWWDPWFYGPPFFVGAPVFLAHGFHHFHHGFSHGGFRHGGFGHGGGFHGGHR